MKKSITIQNLKLLNFKGVKSLSIDLESQTNIYGANGSGKTTISDAFTWLLFGKDTSDRKDFEIKTLDKNGVVIPKIEHEVSASLLIDDEPLTIKRILKENWVKKRGAETSEFTGNVTELYWNEVPVSTTEFSKKVSDILNEQVFKMITSPTYFNSIKWQDRRNLLIDVFGELSNEEVAKGNTSYEILISKLTQDKTLEDYNAQIKASIKKAKEYLKDIPTRIDEANRSMPQEEDFSTLETNLSIAQNQLEKVDSEIADINKAYDSKLASQRDLKLKANNIQSDIEIIEANTKKEAEARLRPDTAILNNLKIEEQSLMTDLYSFENALKTLESKKEGIVQQIADTVSKMNTLRSKWEEENAKELTFNDADFHCPTCKREFESGDVEAKKSEAIANFNINKKAILQQINTEGTNLKSQKENLETELTSFESRIETGKNSIGNAKTALQAVINKIEIETANTTTKGLEVQSFENVYESFLVLNNSYQEKLLELDAVKASIEEVPTVSNLELVEKRNTLITTIDSIKTKLQSKSQIEATKKRIAELEQDEKTLAQQIANVEKEQFVIENFIKAKVDALEKNINSKFKFVKFKMFDLQINGGLKETCEATVNGVPYSDLNTASRINAGLDIINVFSEFYGISAPIFIDNAESVHTLIETDSQLVRLVVSEQHKELLVESKELVA